MISKSGLLIVFLLIASILVSQSATNTKSKLKFTTKASLKKKKLGIFYMAKMFFVSMVDPEVGKVDALGRSTSSPTLLKSKKSSLVAKGSGNQYGLGFSNPSAGSSFGPVCGPNGCQ